MAAKINAPLLQQIEEAKRTDPHQEIPVIVSITPGTDLTVLEQKGLKIHLRFQNIHAVSGTLPASAVQEIATLDQVERIEAEGQMHALQ